VLRADNPILPDVGRTINELYLFVILAIGLGLRLIGILWGLPYLYHPDEYQIVQVYLTMVRNLDLNPHWFIYPSFSIYANSFTYGIYFIGRHLFGSYNRLDISLPKVLVMGTGIMDDPSIFIIGRAVSILFGIGVVVLVYFCVLKVTGNSLAGLVAALFTAVSPVNVEQSRLLLPNIFVAFLVMVVLWFSLQIITNGKLLSYFLAGLFVGFTIAAKYNGAIILVTVIAAHFLRSGYRLKQLHYLLLALIASGLGFIIATPFALLDFHTFLPMMLEARNQYASGWPGQEGQAFMWYVNYLISFEGIIVLTALFTMGIGIIKKDKLVLLISTFPIVYFIFISSMQIRNDKTILPLIPFLHILSGIFLSILFGYVSPSSSRKWLKWIGIGGIALLFIITPIYRTSKTIQSTIEPDSRETARIWIEKNLPRGSFISLGAYSPYVSPKKYHVVPDRGFEPQSLSWYTERDVQYLVFSQGMFGRYFSEPEKYKQIKDKYEDLFSQLDPVKFFYDGNYEIRIYQIYPVGN
jgi:4-amino-4-deoxy-L-arabinose transferase-like glycosyltransferase